MWKQVRAVLYWTKQPMEIKEQRSDVGKYWSFVDEANGAVDHSLNFIKE